MSEAIKRALAEIRGRKRELQDELATLEKAEASLVPLADNTSGGFPQLRGRLPAVKVELVSLSRTIRQVVAELDGATTAEIIDRVRAYNAHANSNSVRSLLSVWASRGVIERKGEKYYPKKTPEAGQAAPGV